MFLFLAVGGPQEGHALDQSTCARASLDSGTCMNKIAWIILSRYQRVYSCLHSVYFFAISRELREYVLVLSTTLCESWRLCAAVRAAPILRSSGGVRGHLSVLLRLASGAPEFPRGLQGLSCRCGCLSRFSAPLSAPAPRSPRGLSGNLCMLFGHRCYALGGSFASDLAPWALSGGGFLSSERGRAPHTLGEF
jgi:hypothetical protein